MALAPAMGRAQNSAAAAVTHSAANPGALTPGAVSAVLGAQHDCSHQPFLVDQAFQATATATGADTVRIDWKIADGCYLYRNRIKVKAAGGAAQLGALALPEGEPHSDEYFGKQQIYHHALSATLPVTRTRGSGALDLAVDVTYQGCAEVGLCYPPTTKTLKVRLPPTAAADAATGSGAPGEQPKFLNA